MDWEKHHSGSVVSQPSQDICSLCYVFSNRHKYNLSNSKLFLPESEREGGDTDDTTNKEGEREDSNTNKVRGKQVVDSENVPLSALAEEDDPEDIPLATLEAQLLEFDSENETLEEVMAQIKNNFQPFKQEKERSNHMRK